MHFSFSSLRLALVVKMAFVVSFLAAGNFDGICLAQLDEVVQLNDAKPAAAEKKETKEKKTEATKQEDDTAAQETPEDSKPEKPKISNQFAQLHLRDGSIIGGEIETTTIDVKTRFGMLTIPISRVLKIYPGLNSCPTLKDKIATYVEDLGSDDKVKCEVAQRDLLAMGLKISKVISTYEDGGNKERAKRLDEIRAALDEMKDEAEDEAITPDTPLEYTDKIVTPDFAIVGEIQQKEFQFKSKFGQLKVQLGDITLADRQIGIGRGEIRKNVSVGAMAFFQTNPKSTGIRVQKGDKVTIKADGIVQWTNWNNSSTPAGLTNRSQWNGINSGTLVARVGTDNSKCVSIGTGSTFTAKKGGLLYLGIAMRDSYASNSGYTWTGEYKAKVRISE